LSAQGAGDLNFELIYSDYDALFKGLMRNVFTTATVTDTSISFDAASQQVRDSGSGFTVAAGFTYYTWVQISGAYNEENNGIFRVTVRADGALTLANGSNTVVDESAGETITVTEHYMRNSTNNYSFLLEKQFLDVDEYIYFPGTVVSTMALNTTAVEIINGTFGVQMQQGVSMTTSIADSVTDASGNEQVTASANVGTILVDNASFAVPLRSIVLNVDNNIRLRPQVGSKYTSDFGRGRFMVSGTVEAYFEDDTLYTKLIDHTAATLSWRVTDADGNIIIFTVAEVYFNAGSPDATGPDADVMLPLSYDATVNNATGYDFTMEIATFAA